MKKSTDFFKTLGAILLIAALVIGAAYFKVWAFQVNHPNTPWWGILVHE